MLAGSRAMCGMTCSRFVRVFFAVVWLFSLSQVRGQLAPGAGYVYPPVVQPGTTVNVQMGVFDPTPDVQWFVHDARVGLRISGPAGDFHVPPPPYWKGPRGGTNAPPIPREVPAELTIPADQPEGFVSWQLANANGVSKTARFLVSRGAEIIETRSRDLPQVLPALPVSVSGRLSRLTEVDRYALTAERDGPISVSLMARRLGADFRGMLQVHDESGQLLADFADTEGVDGGLTFAASAGRRYIVSLNDVDFRGDRAYVYRLSLQSGPRVLCTIPARGRRGAAVDVEFIGQGLQSGGSAIEVLRQSVQFPADAAAELVVQLQTAWGSVPVPIPLSDLAEQRCGDEAVQTLEASGAAVTGRLGPQREEQRFVFEALAGERFSIDLQSAAIGGALDTVLAVEGPDGKLLAENDDSVGTDSRLDVTATAAGRYTCLVKAAESLTGQADDVYRLQLQRQPVDFQLQAPQQVLLPSGGQVEVAITVQRLGGFDGEITVAADGLPPGVSAEGEWKIPQGKNDLKAVLKSAADAAVVAAAVKFRGTANVNGAEQTRVAMVEGAGTLCPVSAADRRVPASLLAMTMTAPIDVLVIDRERQRDVHRGTTYLAELEIVRKAGFTGEVTLVMTGQQDRNRQGMLGETTVIPPGETKAFYPCFMPEWLATDITRRMIVHGIAVVPDPQGHLRYLTKPGDARITMIMEGALLKLALGTASVSAQQSSVLEVPFSISRSPRLPLPVTVRVHVPEELSGALQCAAVELLPGTDQGVLRIEAAADSRLQGLWPLKVTATALQGGRWPVVSESELELGFPGGCH
ncbi:MAG: hypothetical protein RIT02_3459 [Planctomycetota bacterium]